MASRTIFTLGYQNLSLVDFVRLVKEQGISRVIDIRENTRVLSRRVPFSPEQLQQLLTNVSVEYVRLPEAGMPDELIERPSANGNKTKYIDEYINNLKTSKALVKRIIQLFDSGKVLIMCMEEDASTCFRKPFATFVAAVLGGKIEIKELSARDLKPLEIPPPEPRPEKG